MSSRSCALGVELREVSKSLGGRCVLDNLSMCVSKGSIYGLLGHNGMGKTTILRLILGLISADSGSICVNGLNVDENGSATRRSCGVLLETDGLYEQLSCMDNLSFFAAAYGMRKPDALDRIEYLLKRFALWERRSDTVKTWSKGMRHKCALVRALLHSPAVLLLDEPFSSLDPEAAADLRSLLRQLAAQENMAILITSHDLEHVERSCDTIGILRNGRIKAEGTLSAITAQLAGKTFFILAEISDDLCSRAKRDNVITCYLKRMGGVEVSSKLELPAVLQYLTLSANVQVLSPSLEHSYIIANQEGE